jgi:hypothetical protein
MLLRILKMLTETQRFREKGMEIAKFLLISTGQSAFSSFG